MPDRTGRKGKTEIQKFEYYLKNKKSFIDEIKNIFVVFKTGYHLVEKVKT